MLEEAGEFKEYIRNIQIKSIDCGHATLMKMSAFVIALCLKHIFFSLLT